MNWITAQLICFILPNTHHFLSSPDGAVQEVKWSPCFLYSDRLGPLGLRGMGMTEQGKQDFSSGSHTHSLAIGWARNLNFSNYREAPQDSPGCLSGERRWVLQRLALSQGDARMQADQAACTLLSQRYCCNKAEESITTFLFYHWFSFPVVQQRVSHLFVQSLCHHKYFYEGTNEMLSNVCFHL